MQVSNKSVFSRFNIEQNQANTDLAGKAAAGNEDALTALSEIAKVDPAVMREALKAAAEDLVFGASKTVSSKDLAGLPAGNAGAGATVRHLGGFRDVPTSKDKAESIAELLNQPGLTAEGALAAVEQALGDYRIELSEHESIAQLLLRADLTPAARDILRSFTNEASDRHDKRTSDFHLFAGAADLFDKLVNGRANPDVDGLVMPGGWGTPSLKDQVLDSAVVPMKDAPISEASDQDQQTFKALQEKVEQRQLSIRGAAIEVGSIENAGLRTEAAKLLAANLDDGAEADNLISELRRAFRPGAQLTPALLALATNANVSSQDLVNAVEVGFNLGTTNSGGRPDYARGLDSALVAAFEARGTPSEDREVFGMLYRMTDFGYPTDQERIAVGEKLFGKIANPPWA